MLGLASITSAMLAGVAAASKELIFCSAPSSNKRKSPSLRPLTRVPSGAVTVHCTSTRSTRDRITGTRSSGGGSGSSAALTRISPVTRSREIRTSCSSMRVFGSLVFCARPATEGERLITIATANRHARLSRSWNLGIKSMAALASRTVSYTRLFQVEIPNGLFRRSFARFLQCLFKLARQDIFLLVFGLPGFTELVLATLRLIRQNPRGVGDIHVRSGFRGRCMGQNGG